MRILWLLKLQVRGEDVGVEGDTLLLEALSEISFHSYPFFGVSEVGEP